MPFLLADRRDRGLLVDDASSGIRTFTRDARRARLFANPFDARTWASERLLACEYEATVLLHARALFKKNPAQAGQPGGASPTNENGAESGQEQRRRGGQTDEVYGIEFP